MKAVTFVGPGQPLQVAEVPKPSAYPGSLVFKVKACGICGSDLHAVEVPGLLQAGNVLGHEYCGEVVEVGPDVQGWEIGDRLTAVPARPCGECPECRQGRYSECTQIIAQGFDARMPGAYAEYSTCMAGLAIKVPNTLNDKEAAVIEPLAVGFNACRTAKLDAGASVLVIGAGVIGLAVAKWAKFFGAAEVAISEMVPARIARAQAADADLVIDAREHPDPVHEFGRQTGRKPMVIFECVGRPMIANLIAMAPTGAHLVMVGTGMQPENFTVLSAAMKRLRMTFPFAYVPSDFEFVQRMLTTRRVSADGLVTDTVSLDDAPEMFARLGKPNDFGKVLILP